MAIRRISFFGSPGAGKSTTAAWLFSELKDRQFHCELVTEWVKKLAHKKTKLHRWSQLQIFTEQLLSEYELIQSDSDIVTISDSPLCLGWMYSRYNDLPYADELHSIWRKYQNENPNELLIRLEPGERPYNPKGRWQTKDESMEIDKKFLEWLEDEGVCYAAFKTNNRKEILAYVLTSLKEE